MPSFGQHPDPLPADGFDLAHEPFRPDVLGRIGLHHLDGDLPPVARVFGKVYGGHAALTEGAHNGIRPERQHPTESIL